MLNFLGAFYRERRFRCFLHIGHWNVLDITKVFSDAYEMLEDELLTEDDFRDFTFTNAARLDAETNSNFTREQR